MSLKSPVTYAEWYFKHRLDGDKEFDESVERALSPQFDALFASIPELSELPPAIQGFLAPLAAPPSAGLGGFLTSSAGEFASEIVRDAIAPALKMLKRSTNKRGKETWLTSQQAITLAHRGKMGDDFLYEITDSEGYERILADFLYEAQLPYPSIPDIMVWARYHGDPDNTRGAVSKRFNVSPLDYDLWEWQTLQRLTTEQVQRLYKRGKISETEALTELARIGWSADDRTRVRDQCYVLPNAMLQIQGGLIQGVSSAEILKDISQSDIHPDYAQKYLDAVLTKPSSQDIISYQLRQDPNLSNLANELKKIGVHSEYFDLYKELAYPIPPIPDLVTMAVREAFSPEIAARFGQYEDFPKDFEEYAGKRGLSSEWATRYWAAHWNLPSPTQGFEMLHRGVINRDELNMLLRAQDVMPFWRDKLVAIAYRPLTRVDVRRMYKLGVLDEAEVYEAYLDAGYADENAKRMAEFTVKQTLATQSKFTSGDIVRAFTKRMISRGEATSLLGMIDIKSDVANRIIQTAEYKREWAFTDQKIRGIKNLYKKKVYDYNQTKGKLSGLNLPSDQIEILMEQWYYEIKDEPIQTWTTAQTLAFTKKGLITPDRAQLELVRIGYDAEHIEVYMESIK